VPCPIAPGSTFAWAKDGVTLANGGRITGATRRTLRIAVLDESDSGWYRCVYDDGTKSIQVFEAHVEVGEQLPAFAPLGVLVLALAFCVAGVVERRRRR